MPRAAGALVGLEEKRQGEFVEGGVECGDEPTPLELSRSGTNCRASSVSGVP
jgi:hypothetical protein